MKNWPTDANKVTKNTERTHKSFNLKWGLTDLVSSQPLFRSTFKSVKWVTISYWSWNLLLDLSTFDGWHLMSEGCLCMWNCAVTSSGGSGYSPTAAGSQHDEPPPQKGGGAIPCRILCKQASLNLLKGSKLKILYFWRVGQWRKEINFLSSTFTAFFEERFNWF